MNFSSTEIEALFGSIEEFLPIGSYEWDKVEKDHHEVFPELDRTKDTLKRKFKELYQKKIPTGDPSCPPEVRKAKILNRYIIEKAEVSDCENGLSNESVDNEEESEVLDDEEEEPVAVTAPAQQRKKPKSARSTSTSAPSSASSTYSLPKLKMRPTKTCHEIHDQNPMTMTQIMNFMAHDMMAKS